MNRNRNLRAGYQNKPDAMRELADKLMNHPGTAKDVNMSRSAAEQERMRMYKSGGSVKKKAGGHVDIFIEKMNNNYKSKKSDSHKSKKSDDNVDIFIQKKAGGSVKKKSCGHTDKSSHKSTTKKFAAGGVAKIRHKQATKSGAPLPSSRLKKGCRGV